MCVWCGVVVVVCVQYVCVKCMCSVRAFVCMHTRVCVMCVWFIFYWYSFLYMCVFPCVVHVYRILSFS